MFIWWLAPVLHTSPSLLSLLSPSSCYRLFLSHLHLTPSPLLFLLFFCLPFFSLFLSLPLNLYMSSPHSLFTCLSSTTLYLLACLPPFLAPSFLSLRLSHHVPSRYSLLSLPLSSALCLWEQACREELRSVVCDMQTLTAEKEDLNLLFSQRAEKVMQVMWLSCDWIPLLGDNIHVGGIVMCLMFVGSIVMWLAMVSFRGGGGELISGANFNTGYITLEGS